MPEGPEIRRAADGLREAVAGERLTGVFFAFAHLKGFERQLTGRRVVSISSRGKAIVTRFDNGLNLYTHNQLYGRWQIVPHGELPDSRRSLRVALHVSSHSALLYSASTIEILKDVQLRQHPYLSRLGPELLDESLIHDEVVARFMRPRHRRKRLMNLLVDQQIVSGMGNYLCCEALFVTRLYPGARVMDCSAQQIGQLAHNSLRLTRTSYHSGGITNDLQRVEQLRRSGAGFEEYRFQVYRRAGQPCYVCGTVVAKETMQGRPIYYCPVCQPDGSS